MADRIYTRDLAADVLSYILDIFERYGKPMGSVRPGCELYTDLLDAIEVGVSAGVSAAAWTARELGDADIIEGRFEIEEG